jgi:sugar phosphate isomerase/epimerase
VPERCVDLLREVDSPALRSTFDAGNFVQCGVRLYTEAYPRLRPYLAYIQIKDVSAPTGRAVPAGQGDGEIPETLAALWDSGFDGFFSLEPHLAQPDVEGRPPELFRTAVQALKRLLDDLSVPWV